jgi:hypothetical protein
MCKRLLGDNNISSQLLLLNGYFNICIARGADATPSDPFSVLFSAGGDPLVAPITSIELLAGMYG